ncbi:DUF3298 and DUF4163 domain-containing protein [Echinicola vietnamensis]|uniref:Deacetylase PdaC domain-containing protein n=1 Tax=Echinicola vietnamensis (strain DSM 17526 / LMG 23754 / KMM 6221) TaxID=926556 RepID=L0FU69_ECHVK|nr:DUF3298 and DUF4163 domain-containing protein [Echinicola vietnamensis]AGA76306.1 Protein of unknown function (DUF3298) [Echinicola vietnamensis DSM 17526]
MLKLSTFIGLLLLLMGCSPEKQENNERLELAHKQVSMEKVSCVGTDSTCAKVRMVYPEFYNGPEQQAAWLNTHVKEQLLMYLQWGEDSVKTDKLEKAAAGFLEDFEEFSETYSSGSMPWFLETKATVTFKGPQALSLVFTNSSFTGGAHPNHTVMFLNFDLKNQQLLKNEAIVLDQARLLEKTEKAFREFHEVAPAMSLEEDGRFFLQDGKFFLPAAMGYEKDSLVLMYNSYEIGPYSMGQTELHLPLKDLDGIVWIP